MCISRHECPHLCQAEFSSEELCHGRAVTDLSWSPHHPELLLTSYDRGSSRMRLQETSSEGLALVWSLLRETVCLHCSAGMGVACVAPHSLSLCAGARVHVHVPNSSVGSLVPHVRPIPGPRWHLLWPGALGDVVQPGQHVRVVAMLVVSGTHTQGCVCVHLLTRTLTCALQMVLWDYRAKHSPVQQTPLSATGHTHPVYSMAVVGATNAHSLVSVSTDGRMCLWNMSKLVEPVVRCAGCARGLAAACS